MLRSTASPLLDVFVHHRTSLRRVALGILGNPARADDLVQDACLKAVAAHADGVTDPVRYAFRMVRNMAFDACRRTVREARLFDDEAAGATVAAHGGSPERVAIERQQLQLVAAVLGRLPERTRRVVEWCRLEGRSQREIAARLDVSPAMVNLLLRDAVERCRAALARA
jgi:RNA polymerase sigma factor (sigma-70 family)